jgi:hypothetical protein
MRRRSTEYLVGMPPQSFELVSVDVPAWCATPNLLIMCKERSIFDSSYVMCTVLFFSPTLLSIPSSCTLLNLAYPKALFVSPAILRSTLPALLHVSQREVISL